MFSANDAEILKRLNQLCEQPSERTCVESLLRVFKMPKLAPKRKAATQQVNPAASPKHSHFSDAPAAGKCHPSLLHNLSQDLLRDAAASTVYGVTNMSKRKITDSRVDPLESQGE